MKISTTFFVENRKKRILTNDKELKLDISKDKEEGEGLKPNKQD